MNNSTHCGLTDIFFLLLGVKVRYEWMYEGQWGLAGPHTGARRSELKWGGIGIDNGGNEVAHFSLVLFMSHDPGWLTRLSWQDSQLLLLRQQVPTGRWANPHGIKYSPSHGRHSVCPLLLYISMPTINPLACSYWNDLWKWPSVLCRLIKTPCMEQMM